MRLIHFSAIVGQIVSVLSGLVAPPPNFPQTFSWIKIKIKDSQQPVHDSPVFSSHLFLVLLHVLGQDSVGGAVRLSVTVRLGCMFLSRTPTHSFDFIVFCTHIRCSKEAPEQN